MTALETSAAGHPVHPRGRRAPARGPVSARRAQHRARRGRGQVQGRGPDQAQGRGPDRGHRYDAIKLKKPLSGIKIAGYVDCQTNRPFGIAGESYENPKYLDKLVESLGGDSIPDYEKKVECCGGALAFSEPEKSQEMVKGIIEAAYDHGAEMIVTPCPVCQMNVEVYQDQINAPYGTKFKISVVYYWTLMAVAYGRSARDAALNGQLQSSSLRSLLCRTVLPSGRAVRRQRAALSGPLSLRLTQPSSWSRWRGSNRPARHLPTLRTPRKRASCFSGAFGSGQSVTSATTERCGAGTRSQPRRAMPWRSQPHRRGLGRHSVNRRAAARDPPLVAIPAYFSLSGLAKFLADCTMISERSLLLASVSELSDAFTL
jgi:hypothetical protein